MSERYRATPCPCGHKTCKSWHVEPVAAMQGVNFMQDQAEAVAELLNGNDLREALKQIAEVDDGISVSRDHTRCYSCFEMHELAVKALKVKP